jgi:phospholipid transport system substrate-binding protein
VSNDPRLCRGVHDAATPVSTPRRRFVQSSLALAGGCLVAGRRTAAAQDAASPAAPVERLHGALVSAAEAGRTTRARFERLLPVVEDVFDFRTMSRLAVGSAWEEFGEAERRALEERFAAYAAANYADNFDDASGLAFRTLEVGEADGPRVQVLTELSRPRGEPVTFDYLVQRTDDGPRIVNVVVDGTMNELARRRAEFRSLLQAGGIDNLLATLAAQTQARLS